MKKVVLVVLVAVLVAVGFAYAAANTVPVTGAGDGSEVISGYEVSKIHYGLLSSNPSFIDTVSFSLDRSVDATNGTVKIELVEDSNIWFPCSSTDGTAWTCAIDGDVTVLAANNLRVVAAQ